VLGFLGASENLAFVIALVIMVMIGVVEAIGLGSSALGHDVDLAESDWLSWLGFGRLPLLMLLVVFLASFGMIGLTGQQTFLTLTGAMLPGTLAVPASAFASLPATALLARLLGRVIPRDETTAIGVEQLVGLHAEIIVGLARQGSPAKARVKDFHGQTHYVMAEPDDPTTSFGEGDEILLVRRHGHIFRAISSGRSPFSNWIQS